MNGGRRLIRAVGLASALWQRVAWALGRMGCCGLLAGMTAVPTVWAAPGFEQAGVGTVPQTQAAQACRVLDPELQLSYTGDCANGLAQGQGVARGAQGAWYQGGFEAGMKSGHGVKIYPNGDAYTGGWLRDMREGQGRYEFGLGSPWRGDVYQGGWHLDQREGEGTYIFYPSGDRFLAQWVKGVTDTVGTTTVTRRKQAFEALSPVIGKEGAWVCSVLTQGAGPDRVAHGQVLAALADRVLVRIDTPQVLAHSPYPALNPRWEILTQWLPCEAKQG